MQEVPQSQFSRETRHFPPATALLMELGELTCACLSSGTGLAWFVLRNTLSDWHQLFSKVGMGGERTFRDNRKRKDSRNSGLLGLSFSAVARSGVIK